MLDLFIIIEKLRNNSEKRRKNRKIREFSDKISENRAPHTLKGSFLFLIFWGQGRYSYKIYKIWTKYQRKMVKLDKILQN